MRAAFRPARPRYGAGIAGSILVHAAVGAFLLASPVRRDDGLEAVTLEVARKPPPPPVEPEPEPEPPPPEPEPEPEPVRPRIAKAAPEPPAPEPPPETPPPEAPPAPPVFDMSADSFSGEGVSWQGLAPNEGNSRFGKIGRAATPNSRPDRPEGVPGGTGKAPAPPAARITRMPSVDFEGQAVYPEQARRERIDGVVTLLVEVLRSGRVGQVRVVDDPGFGLGRAAQIAMRSFRFSPALDQGGDAVAHTIRYRFRFELPD